MSLASGTNLGPYQILAAIGAGGMGEVYRARDTKLKREVALKVLPEEFALDSGRMIRFQREAETLASLNHPNIAAIYGVEERALVMELVEGGTLPCPLPLDTALRYAKQISEALEYAHDRGIIHRDLKPANIKVTPEGTVKLLDFGLAKAVEAPRAADDDPGNSPTMTLGATRVGVILGTAAYMSPEQAAGKSADRRSDVWSFGAVLYEMLAGKQAFAGESVSDTLASVLKLDPDWNALPASTPAPVRKLIQRCLTRDRKQRLQAIGEARIAIDAQLTNPESNVAVPSQAPARSSRRPWMLAAALMTLALAAVSLIHFREPRPNEHALYYTIPTPAGGTVSEFAISPDGRYVVIAVSVNGKSQLWLRALGELEAQPMPFTEDAGGPFWSADSRSIGFYAQGRLKRISVSGGPAQALSPAPLRSAGGSWSRDDMILFPVSGGLQRVSAAGGVPTTIIRGEGFYRFPVFLLDGDHFLYTAGSVRSDASVYWTSSSRGDSRAILKNAAGAIFAPLSPESSDGHLLFVRQDTLMAQRFNAARGELLGDAFVIAEGVALNPRGPYSPVVASANGVLMYWNNAAAASSEIVWYDRQTGKQTGSLGATGNVIEPSISPRDEKTIVFARQSGPRGDLWSWDVDRGTDQKLTNDPSRNTTPFFAPEGGRIVFRSFRNGSDGDLYLKNLGGSGEDELLLKSATPKIPSQWSFDGQFIVYTDLGENGARDIWVLPVGDSGPAGRTPRLFLKSARQGQLSPDGHWMAYSSNESGPFEIYVASFPDASLVKKKLSTAGGVQPRWRADGKELYFVATGGKMSVVTVKSTAGPRPSFEAGTPAALFDVHIDETAVATHYDVTRDGSRFLVETPGVSTTQRLTVWANWLAGFKR
jgi:serine/threonine protein kinase/Tol biopolymer transport system component